MQASTQVAFLQDSSAMSVRDAFKMNQISVDWGPSDTGDIRPVNIGRNRRHNCIIPNARWLAKDRRGKNIMTQYDRGNAYRAVHLYLYI